MKKILLSFVLFLACSQELPILEPTPFVTLTIQRVPEIGGRVYIFDRDDFWVVHIFTKKSYNFVGVGGLKKDDWIDENRVYILKSSNREVTINFIKR